MSGDSPTIVPNRRDVAHESFEDEVILIHFPTGRYYRFDAPGRVAWAAVERGATVGGVAAALRGAYDVGEPEARAAAEAFASRLREEGLAIEDAAAAPGTPPPPVAGRAPFAPPGVEVFTDLADLFLVDPIHDVDETGWPHAKA